MLSSLIGGASRGGATGKLSTLIFHRVLPRRDALFPNEVDAARFDAICSWVKQWFNVIPLDDAVRALPRKTLPARALAITFDDGYADNHDVALPILKRHGLPATFFIATGFTDGGRMWNDTVIESLRACVRSSLDLSQLNVAGLGVLALDGPMQRRAAIDSILAAIKYLPALQRQQMVQAVAEICESRPPNDLMMRSEQIRTLHRSGMQIGAHTVSHPILARLPDAAALGEIVGSKASLERLLGEPVALFAYPNGRPQQDFNERTVQLVREAGFEACVTTAPGVADWRTDLHQIPRYTPWEQSKLRFGARLLGNLFKPLHDGVEAASR